MHIIIPSEESFEVRCQRDVRYKIERGRGYIAHAQSGHTCRGQFKVRGPAEHGHYATATLELVHGTQGGLASSKERDQPLLRVL
jgi:hypothetical protein